MDNSIFLKQWEEFEVIFVPLIVTVLTGFNPLGAQKFIGVKISKNVKKAKWINTDPSINKINFKQLHSSH